MIGELFPVKGETLMLQRNTDAAHGLTCLSPVGDRTCGEPVTWFDYELGEKEFYKGLVCDAHRVSDRVEKLAVPQTATVTA